MAFQNAHQFVIDNTHGHLNNAQNINYINQLDPMTILLKNSAIEATHESPTAAYAPKCKPGTRKEVIKDIMNWMLAGGSVTAPSSIIWFSGPAGGGKTCIQREVARLCQEKGILAASYFFSTRITGLDKSGPFVATIAHQLAERIPGLRPFIGAEIQNYPSIFQKSLDVQLEHLVLRPLLALRDEQQTGRGSQFNHEPPVRVLAIDGFDECRSSNERRHLLHLLHTLATNPHFPFRIEIASRPEFDIRTAFATEPLSSLTHHIRLENYDGSSDIRDSLCDEFARIRDTHPSKLYIPPNWPSEGDLEALVSTSSGQFIYASTVIKFVDNHRRNPVTLLKQVMDASARSTTENPFADLDALYSLILHPPEIDIMLLKRLLHSIMAISLPSRYLVDPAFLDHLFCLEPGATTMLLCDLHSVIQVPGSSSKENVIRFHHKSLEDFLRSQKRSGDLFQSDEETHRDVGALCAHQIQLWLSNPLARPSEATIYSVSFWAIHVKLALGKDDMSGFVSLPNSVLDINPGAVIIGRSFHLRLVYQWDPNISMHLKDLQLLRETLHRRCCRPGRNCLQLCQRLAHIQSVNGEIEMLFTQASKINQSELQERRAEWLPTLEKLLTPPPNPKPRHQRAIERLKTLFARLMRRP